MKKYFILFLFIVFHLTYSASCDNSLSGHLELIAFEGDNESEYQGYSYKEGDILFIRSFILENTGNCSIKNIEISFFITEPSGETLDFKTFVIDSLVPGQNHTFSSQDDDPYWMKNKNVVSVGHKFDELGIYHIDYNIEAEEEPIEVTDLQNQSMSQTSYGILINDEYAGIYTFSVKSETELKL